MLSQIYAKRCPESMQNHFGQQSIDPIASGDKITLKALPNFHQTLDDLCSYCKDNADSIALRVLTIISELVNSIFTTSLILIIDCEGQKGHRVDTDKIN